MMDCLNIEFLLCATRESHTLRNECCDVFRSDVWSLGCVLYELCALRHPVTPSHINLHIPVSFASLG